MKIRKAKISDIAKIKKIDIIRKILNKCSPLDKLDPYFKPKGKRKTYYEKFIYGGDSWCYVADDFGKIKGFILFKIEKREPWYKIKKTGLIDLVMVNKDDKKKGLSKLLMNQAYQIFREKGINYVKLTVHTDNIIAVNVWKKHGFKEFRLDMYKKIK